MRRLIALVVLVTGSLACNAPFGSPESGKTLITPPEQPGDSEQGSSPDGETYDEQPGDSESGSASDWETYDEQEPSHIELNEPHEAYNSDPPTSGPHYPQWAEAGLYDEVVSDGFLIHNMEHGYVIIWYDCSSLSNEDCADLQREIYEVIQDHDGYKIIGAPREGMPTLLALTSWTKLGRLDEFDRDYIEAFIDANQNHSPEPDAP